MGLSVMVWATVTVNSLPVVISSRTRFLATFFKIANVLSGEVSWKGSRIVLIKKDSDPFWFNGNRAEDINKTDHDD